MCLEGLNDEQVLIEVVNMIALTIAYKILGNGNIAPNRLASSPTIPPTVTIHFDQIQPISWKACGSGASEFYKAMTLIDF